jgi:hypothetical protein
MSGKCPVCECEQAESLLCHADTTRLERDLGDVTSIVAELDVTRSRQAKIGASGKSGKGWAREKLPIHIGAIEAGDVLANTLTTWARDVTEGRNWVWVAGDRAPSEQSARALLMCIPDIRKHPAVVELVDEISDAIRQARHAVDRPADRVYFGACYSETPDEDGRTVTCLEEIWASPSATEVQCRVCGTEWEIAERRAWLLKKAEDMIVTIADASTYLGDIGNIRVTQASIRGYVHRKRLMYRAPIEAKRIRLGDLLALLLDESEKAERKGAA